MKHYVKKGGGRVRIYNNKLLCNVTVHIYSDMYKKKKKNTIPYPIVNFFGIP